MRLVVDFFAASSLFYENYTRYWLRQPRLLAAVLFAGIGLGYTVYSEWHNTTVSKTWEYAPLMPVIFGIGLSPLLQWLVIPPAVMWLGHRELARTTT